MYFSTFLLKDKSMVTYSPVIAYKKNISGGGGGKKNVYFNSVLLLQNIVNNKNNETKLFVICPERETNRRNKYNQKVGV